MSNSPENDTDVEVDCYEDLFLDSYRDGYSDPGSRDVLAAIGIVLFVAGLILITIGGAVYEALRWFGLI